METLKKLGNIFLGILGIIFLVIVIVVWLGYLGIIPQGDKSDDRYFDEMHQPFR